MITQITTHNWLSNLKLIFKNHLFILFSFVNLFIPFYATMMAALIPNYGAINVIAIGLSTSFITIFNQFLFILSLCFIFVLEKDKKKTTNNIDRQSIYLAMVIVSIITIALLVTTSFCYIYFSTIYKNISESKYYGFEYIGIVSLSLFFNIFIYVNIMYKHLENKSHSSINLFIFFCLNLLFIPLFGILIPWNSKLSSFGIGLGISTSSLIMFLYFFILNFKKKNFWIRGNIRSLKIIIHKIKSFTFNFLLSTVMKSILIMAIALSLGLGQKDTPPGMMIAKIIWYNSLFFCGFFADGLLYSTQFTRLEYIAKGHKSIIDFKTWNILILITFIGTLATCIIFDFVAMYLPSLYMSHQTQPIYNPIPNWNVNITNEIKNYLWSPNGMINFKLINMTTGTFETSSGFCIMYTTIYHIFINLTKIMSFPDIELEQKFSWKKLMSNFAVIAFVMVFVVIFSIVPNSNGFNNIFPGLDSFSFSLMIVAILLFILTFLGFIKQQRINR